MARFYARYVKNTRINKVFALFKLFTEKSKKPHLRHFRRNTDIFFKKNQHIFLKLYFQLRRKPKKGQSPPLTCFFLGDEVLETKLYSRQAFCEDDALILSFCLFNLSLPFYGLRYPFLKGEVCLCHTKYRTSALLLIKTPVFNLPLQLVHTKDSS